MPCICLVFSSFFFFFGNLQLSLLTAQHDTEISVSAARDSVITALEGGWPCGRSLPRHHFPPSVELAGYDYRTLLNRVLEKSSCKLTKPGFVLRTGVST